MDEPFVTVIIPTFNREEVLCNSISGVLEQLYPRFEVIVVDQSQDHNPDTWTYLNTNSSKFKYIQLSEPGLPNARNEGIKAAEGKIIVFCDDDIKPNPDWIYYHALNYKDESIGAVGGRIIEFGLPVIEGTNYGYINIWGRPVGNFTSMSPSLIRTVRGGNMSFSRRALDIVGGFDTRYIGTSTLEETDICYRIARSGFKIKYEPRAELLHIPQTSGNISWRSNLPLEWYRNYLHNGTLFMLKNKSRLEIPTFLFAQLLIAIKHGMLKQKSLKATANILSGIPAGYSSYSRQMQNEK